MLQSHMYITVYHVSVTENDGKTISHVAHIWELVMGRV